MNTASRDQDAEAWRRSKWHEDGFRGDSAYEEAPKVILRGAWRLCTPPIIVYILFC